MIKFSQIFYPHVFHHLQIDHAYLLSIPLSRKCLTDSEGDAVVILTDRTINTNVNFFGRDHSPPQSCTDTGEHLAAEDVAEIFNSTCYPKKTNHAEAPVKIPAILSLQ